MFDIQHDFHVHTFLSLCADSSATVEHYVKKAKEIGIKKLGFADHFWDSNIKKELSKLGEYAQSFYNTQDFSNISKIKKDLEKYENEGVGLYFGCECEYNPVKKSIAITEECAEQLDFIIVPNSHTHFTMSKELYYPHYNHIYFMIDAYNNILDCNLCKYITAIAHPFDAVASPYSNDIIFKSISDDIFKKMFDKTAQKGIAVEINTGFIKNEDDYRKIENSPKIRMFKIAKEMGCKFILGSDSHSDDGHDMFIKASQKYAKCIGLDDSDILDFAKC